MDLARLLLEAPSPFADPVVRLDIEVAPPPDVVTVHASVRGAISDAIAVVARERRAQMVLVTGRPPGAGYNVVNQISFKLATLADLQAMHARLRAEGIKDFRIVTHGNAWSVYFADPEGNRVELFVDTPWHTPQPFVEPFDIEAPVDAILAQTEAICRSRPGFVSRPEWRQAVAERMAPA